MRTYTRRQLKQDQFAEATVETLSWAAVHRTKLIVGAIVVIAAAAIGLGSWAYLQSQQQQAGMALAKAMNTYNAPLRSPETPAEPEVLSFTSAAERARVAHNEFQKIAQQYSHANAGRLARYFAAITALQMGDTSAGESELKQVASSGEADVASLAKVALAGYYRDHQRYPDAVRLYKELIEHPTNTVAKSRAELELAATYEANNQTADANKIYEQIIKDDPTGPAAQMANARMKGGK